LRIDGNALSCDCQLTWTLKYNISRIEGECYFPVNLRGKSVTEINLDDSKCRSNNLNTDSNQIKVLDNFINDSEVKKQMHRNVSSEAILVLQKLGTRLELNCSEGKSSWWKNGKKLNYVNDLTISNHEILNYSIIITSLLSTDSGSFVCVKDDDVVAAYNVQVLGMSWVINENSSNIVIIGV